MLIQPNPHLIRFGELAAPAAWRSKEARALFEAGRESETDGTWSDYAVGGTIRVADRPTDPAVSAYGTPHDVAYYRAQRRIAELRAEAQQLEDILRAYGPGAFIEKMQPSQAPPAGSDAEPYLCGILKRRPTHVSVNGRLFATGADRVLRRVAIA